MTTKAPLLGTPREWAFALAAASGAGVVLGLIGPYGSYLNGPPGPRVFHFVVCFWVGAVIFGVLGRLAAAGAARAGVPVLLALIGAIAAGAAPLSLFVAWMATRVWPFLEGRLSPLDWYGQCLILSLPVLAYVLLRRPAGPAARALATVTDPPPVQPGTSPSGDVLCLRMEDHYVRSTPPLARVSSRDRSSG